MYYYDALLSSRSIDLLLARRSSTILVLVPRFLVCMQTHTRTIAIQNHNGVGTPKSETFSKTYFSVSWMLEERKEKFWRHDFCHNFPFFLLTDKQTNSGGRHPYPFRCVRSPISLTHFFSFHCCCSRSFCFHFCVCSIRRHCFKIGTSSFSPVVDGIPYKITKVRVRVSFEERHSPPALVSCPSRDIG